MSLKDQLSNLPNLPKVSGKGAVINIALVAITLLILGGEVFRGNAGCIEIKPGEVAVFYNNTGIGVFGPPVRAEREQGVKTFVPGLQSVIVLEAKPQVLVMGTEPKGAKRGLFADEQAVDVVEPLTVRANDGSNVYFDGLEVHYQIKREEPAKVIDTSGPGDGYKAHVVRTHVREVLRDEFGAYSFLEVANPASYGTATTEAKRVLNERLEPYGVFITQIVTPKPKFDPRVEKAIEDRQNAEQEVAVQEEKRNKLKQESALKVQEVEQQKNAEYQGLVAELEAQKKAADNSLIQVKREADKYFIDRVAEAQAYRDEKVTRAKANEEAYRKEAEALVAKITAVGAQGPDVLNSVIAEKVFPQLKNVSATPLVKPASPIDIRYLNPPRAAGGE